MKFRALPFFLLVFLGATTGRGDQEAGKETQSSVEELTARVKDSLVVISQIGRGGSETELGSGFIISEDGLIATCNHVIGEGRELKVKLASGDEFLATAVHAWDRKLDLAILRIEPKGKKLQALELGDSDALAEGQRVVTIGNPYGLSFSVVEGIVSAIREIEEGSPPFIQMAIPVEPGNSGGPLIDLEGRVLGIVALKSIVADNIGFAVPSNSLKPLLEKPNTVPMKSWVTIGALDPRQWKEAMGARWTQRAGKITAELPGKGFGGRSLCIAQRDVPDVPYEIEVTVRLDDDSGAAGLVFESDGGDVHYGFYPSSGQMRLTRFDGADVYSWNVLKQIPTEAYLSGDWNHLRVRVTEKSIAGFLNGEQILEMEESNLRGGKAGLAKFRQTHAEFKGFRIGKDLSPVRPDPEMLAELQEQLIDLSPSEERLTALSKQTGAVRELLEERRKKLAEEIEEVEQLADAVHRKSVETDLLTVLGEEKESDIDLVRAALLVAKLDNPDLDLEGYLSEFERLAEGVKGAVGKVEGSREQLKALSDFLFQQSGFHGSRNAYYSRSNSYLNEVIDDREGIPITLAVLYIELANRAGIPNLNGLGLPGHFMARHDEGGDDQQLIDVFDGGKFITEEEAIKITGLIPALGESPGDYDISTKREIVTRMLNNLKGISIEMKEPLQALRYADLLIALNPEDAQERLGRALLNAQSERPKKAIPDLDWIFEKEPEGIDLPRLREFYEHLKSQ